MAKPRNKPSRKGQGLRKYCASYTKRLKKKVAHSTPKVQTLEEQSQARREKGKELDSLRRVLLSMNDEERRALLKISPEMTNLDYVIEELRGNKVRLRQKLRSQGYRCNFETGEWEKKR